MTILNATIDLLSLLEPDIGLGLEVEFGEGWRGLLAEAVEKLSPGPLAIDRADFPRMSERCFKDLAELGITTVIQIAEMTPQELDDLPVKGIGKKTSAAWVEISKGLLA